MIFKLNQGGYVPESYRDSRDFRVFLKLLEVLTSVTKSNIDSLVSLYSPADCPDNLLPLLADMLGYEYDSGLSVESSRTILKYFPYLIRYRGSEEGIKLATALSLNTSSSASQAYTLDSILVEFDYDTGLIKIYFPHTDLFNKDLLEVVRPVGSFIKFIPSTTSDNLDELDVKATVRAEVDSYDKNRYQVEESQVGFSDTEKE